MKNLSNKEWEYNRQHQYWWQGTYDNAKFKLNVYKKAIEMINCGMKDNVIASKLDVNVSTIRNIRLNIEDYQKKIVAKENRIKEFEDYCKRENYDWCSLEN